jgi:hypothetical protein
MLMHQVQLVLLLVVVPLVLIRFDQQLVGDIAVISAAVGACPVFAVNKSKYVWPAASKYGAGLDIVTVLVLPLCYLSFFNFFL